MFRIAVYVSAFRDWFRRIGMRPNCWPFGSLHCHAISQTTFSSVRRLSLSDVLYGMKFSFNRLMYFMPLNSFRIFSKNTLLCFLSSFNCFIILLGSFTSFWNQIGVLRWKRFPSFPIPMFVTVLLFPIDHEHRNCTVLMFPFTTASMSAL